MENNYITLLLLSSVSSKLWDFVSLVLMTLFHMLVWETRTYHSANSATTSVSEAILEQVAHTYSVCTGARVFHNDVLLPTGYVVGSCDKGMYLVCISLQEDKHSLAALRCHMGKTSPHYVQLQVIGWWSVRSLVPCSTDIVYKQGEYRIVSQQAGMYTKTWDDWDAKQYHLNCARGARHIQNLVSKRKTGVFFLFGEPGLGKTTTARYLAKTWDAWLCLDFEELYNARCHPVTEIIQMQQYLQPSSERPLVIVLDELDEYLFRRKNEESDEVECTPETKDAVVFRSNNMKKNWGRLLDTVHQSHNIVLLCTSNRHKSFFDTFDNALLRPFRITACLHYVKDSVVVENITPSTQKKSLKQC